MTGGRWEQQFKPLSMPFSARYDKIRKSLPRFKLREDGRPKELDHEQTAS